MGEEQPDLFLARDKLQSLLDALKAAGYQCVGPRADPQQHAIVYDELADVSQLPQGWHDTQSPAEYRLEHSESARCFDWATAAQSIKPWLFKTREILWTATRDSEGRLGFTRQAVEASPLAIIGVRACDLAGMRVQDKHFLKTGEEDVYYQQRRQQLLLVGVNCAHSVETCFCAATGDGPAITHSYDVLLDELDDGFLVQHGSAAGEAIVRQLPTIPATAAYQQQAHEQTRHAAETQTRTLPAVNIQQMLYDNPEHPQWNDVAARCLSCGNCTLVCPTCFCHAQVEVPALDGNSTEHYRQWDSCFTQGHSYIHGVTIHADTRMRYRQWLTHKFAYWHDQYEVSGCVGCGRCITWCPVGIDVTSELMALSKGGNDGAE